MVGIDHERGDRGRGFTSHRCYVGEVHRQCFPADVIGAAPVEIEVDTLDEDVGREQQVVLEYRRVIADPGLAFGG